MAKVIYSGVNSTARKVKNLYIGVNNTARKIKKGYIGVNNIARQCYSSDIIYRWKYYNVTKTYSLSSIISRSGGSSFNASSPSVKLEKSNMARYYEFNYTSTSITSTSTFKYSDTTSYPTPYDKSFNENVYYGVTSYTLNSSQGNLTINGYSYYIESGTEISNISPGTIPYLIYFTDTYITASRLAYTLYRINKTYSKGSTYYGEVTAVNNPNAYPINGQSGNYWYIRQ